MSDGLKFGRRAAKSGQAKNVVVFVHGYGADGRDLLSLSEPLSPHLPDTVFYAPDAPEKSRGNPFGFQWFPIPWLDNSTEAEARASLLRSAEMFNDFLDKILEDEGLSPSQLALVGFSQGTMMSLHVAPRRSEPFAAVVGFSGRLLGPEELASAAVSRPPVLLIHGDADDVVPVQSLSEAADALTAAGFDVFAHVSKGTAHGIAPDGLSLALSFLHEHLGKPV